MATEKVHLARFKAVSGAAVCKTTPQVATTVTHSGDLVLELQTSQATKVCSSNDRHSGELEHQKVRGLDHPSGVLAHQMLLPGRDHPSGELALQMERRPVGSLAAVAGRLNGASVLPRTK